MDTILEKQFTVTHSESAESLGSGELKVLSTPSLVAFMENTAMDIAKGITESKQTTVGIEVNVQHLAATSIGSKILVKATLESQNKNILSYNIEAYDENNQQIGTAEHKRAIVNKKAFMDKLD